MIDVVITWVNSADPQWREKKESFQENRTFQTPMAKKYMDSDERYRDLGTLKYALRSIETNMPWVNHIFLVTDNQVPVWLNNSSSKLTVIDHTEFIPTKYLPTFNSNVIELNLHRIKKLSTNFILFNDDIIVNKMTKESDFFLNDKPKDFCVYDTMIAREQYDHLLLNNISIINRFFYPNGERKKIGRMFNMKYKRFLFRSMLTIDQHGVSSYFNDHGPYLIRKSTISELWDLISNDLNSTSLHHVRTSNDITLLLARYWQLEKDDFIPTNPMRNMFYTVDRIADISKDLEESLHYTLCLNDTKIDNIDEISTMLQKMLSQKFPQKSSFEK